MIQSSDEQLNNLGNEAEYLNQETSKEPEITEVIIPSYHRKKAVGKRESKNNDETILKAPSSMVNW